MRVVFFGTPAFAAASLARLLASSHQVVGIVTQPDRPRGRGQHVSASPVKTLGLEHGLPVLQPTKLGDPALLAELGALGADIGVVAAYGRLLPASLLALPPRGLINVHASILPRWRGAAPVHRAVLAGDTNTGVTIMRVVLALDAGPMLEVATTAIAPDETSAQLEGRLATLGADLLVAVIDRLSIENVPETPQDESAVTYAKRLERSESPIDWSRSSIDLHNHVRGLQPWPLASSHLLGRRVLVLKSTALSTSTSAAPGTVISATSEGLDVVTGRGVLRILEVQLEGKRPMAIGPLLNGWRIQTGDRFDAPASAS